MRFAFNHAASPSLIVEHRKSSMIYVKSWPRGGKCSGRDILSLGFTVENLPALRQIKSFRESEGFMNK
jgi:hypothetical protein